MNVSYMRQVCRSVVVVCVVEKECGEAILFRLWWSPCAREICHDRIDRNWSVEESCWRFGPLGIPNSQPQRQRDRSYATIVDFVSPLSAPVVFCVGPVDCSVSCVVYGQEEEDQRTVSFTRSTPDTAEERNQQPRIVRVPLQE